MSKEKAQLKYLSEDFDSIYEYAKKLKDSSLRKSTSAPDKYSGVHAKKVKGKFGQYLEKYYFWNEK